MALFLIFRGTENTLSQVKLHEGYAYFCTDTGRMWIDISNSGDTTPKYPAPDDAARIPINGALAEGFVIDGDYYSADLFVRGSEISVSGVMIGDGSGAVSGVEIPDKAIVIGDADNGLAGVEVNSAGGLYALADKIPHWGTIPVVAGGTGRASHTANAILTGNGSNTINNVPTASGAFYATGANGTPLFGTLPVALGGTGKTTNTTNAVLTGNGTSAVQNVATKSGALYATAVNGAPQFGTLPIEQGGTGATSAAAARSNLDVYAKNETYTRSETDTEVAKATTLTYVATLDESEWHYNGTASVYNYNYKLLSLRCGADGTVPPIISCTINLDEYNNILSAVAVPKAGIQFTASTKPTNDITLLIVDLG